MNVFSGTLNASATQQQFYSGENLLFRTAYFYAYKSLNGGIGQANTSGLWFGPESGVMPNYLSPSGSLVINLPNRDSIANYYFYGASGDGLVAVTY